MTKMVGGAPMYPSKNIIENAVNSKDHTTLVAAVKAAGLVDTLEGAGPFTVFAPTNEAFARCPPGTVETLLKPENKDKLTAILTYHVVPGRLTEADIDAKITRWRRQGDAEDRPGRGPHLRAQRRALWVIDAKGDKAEVTIPERDAVERRHPGHQQGADPGLSAPRYGSWGKRRAGVHRAPALFSRAARRRAGCAVAARV